MNTKRPPPFRDPARQSLRIFYLEDVTNVGCPVEVLDDVVELVDYAGNRCWLSDDVFKAWRDRCARGGA